MDLLETIQLLYICSTGIAIMATIPQLKKLIIIKSSREFSLGSYAMWSCTQATALLYMISIGNVLLIATTSIWTLYQLTMVGLIIHYRRPQLVVAEATDDLTQSAPASAH